jgi:hypothetical protein
LQFFRKQALELFFKSGDGYPVVKRLSQGETGYFNYKDSLMRLILSLLVIQGCYDRC